MSKSLGNFFTIRDVLQRYSPAAVRWFLLGCQYRQPVNYSSQALDEVRDRRACWRTTNNCVQASARLYYLVHTLVEARAVVESAQGALHEDASAVHQSPVVGACMAALADDLNTPAALAALSQTLREMNDALYTRKGRKAAGRVERLAEQVAVVQHVLGVMGVAADAEVLVDLRRSALVRCVEHSCLPCCTRHHVGRGSRSRRCKTSWRSAGLHGRPRTMRGLTKCASGSRGVGWR